MNVDQSIHVEEICSAGSVLLTLGEGADDGRFQLELEVGRLSFQTELPDFPRELEALHRACVEAGRRAPFARPRWWEELSVGGIAVIVEAGRISFGCANGHGRLDVEVVDEEFAHLRTALAELVAAIGPLVRTLGTGPAPRAAVPPAAPAAA